MNKIAFNKLPIYEIVFVIEFEAISFPSAYLGLYWEKIKDRFPQTEDQPSYFEDENSLFGNTVSKVSFVNPELDRLIQISNNGFGYSYKTDNNNNELDFKSILDDFLSEWNTFKDWYSRFLLQDEKMQINSNNYKLLVSYIFDERLEWFSPQDNPKFFNFINNNIKDFNGELKLYDFQLMLGLPNSLGILQISSDQKIRLEDESFVMFLNLLSQTMEEIEFDDESHLRNWLMSVYEQSLDNLMKLTTENLQEKWR
ncbi:MULTISPECIES: TIGR04255 family protein [Crocosphaera]|uniref:TIGR04255 family protein n=5 Tax=Crocosphaera TaxID=263510 RepID=T2JSL1_CROWT|nr:MULTISPECIES: TIGR04255 family protein [Crocosphaera]EHJ12072.1 hypothetical protein CWATWH0003_3207 [Crocosphaera watsonii WH 0003]MCH2244006.1 TIGR04255 family protein [Crocosphaera sp.]CCQ59158.1 hypothetical protein CWATWH0005_5530 [Crocosphaera watsonii WH 0005]CCQ68195.1 hypothetical protein CWATWH0402_4593 [Crocosphaera watsonii WH 0402]